MVTGTVQHDLPCLECGYNLRTLSNAGCCPECGRLVRESLRSDVLLRNSDPHWLLGLHDGLGMIWRSVLAIVVTVVLAAGLLVAIIAFQPRFSSVLTIEHILQVILYSGGVVVFLIAPFLTIRGLWQFFQPEPNRPTRGTRSMEMALPLAIGGPVAMVGGVFVSMAVLSVPAGRHLPILGGTLIVCEIILWLLLVVFVVHLKNIDERCERAPVGRRRQLRMTRLGASVVGGASVLGTALVLVMMRMSIVAPSPQVMRFIAIPFALVLLWSLLVFALSRGSRQPLEYELQMCEALDVGDAS